MKFMSRSPWYFRCSFIIHQFHQISAFILSLKIFNYVPDINLLFSLTQPTCKVQKNPVFLLISPNFIFFRKKIEIVPIFKTI